MTVGKAVIVQYKVCAKGRRCNRPYSHKLLTINNYVNCPSNFAFARSIYLFHPLIFEKILMRIRSILLASYPGFYRKEGILLDFFGKTFSSVRRDFPHPLNRLWNYRCKTEPHPTSQSLQSIHSSSCRLYINISFTRILSPPPSSKARSRGLGEGGVTDLFQC